MSSTHGAGMAAIPMESVAIILDGEFGERLLDLEADAIWIAASPTNTSVVNEIRRVDRSRNISLFRDIPGTPPAQALADLLPVIDLHHGSYSQDRPYNRIVVYGCRPNHSALGIVAEFGLTFEGPTKDGFSARIPNTPDELVNHNSPGQAT